MYKIKIPATSANIGPGFDCLGIALNLYNEFYINEIESGLTIEGCEEEYNNKDNLIYTSMLKCFNKIGYKYKGIKIKIKNNIPISRGLGSSATCILAGIIGANEIANNPLSKKEILELATEIEGHPDNIAPALFGGMTVSILQNNKVYYSKINIKKGIKFFALIPNYKLSTNQAREALPHNIDYSDATYNVGRVSLLITALQNGDFKLLDIACNDKLHQPYRKKLIDNFDLIVNECKLNGSLGTFLSGAGPTILAITEEKNTNFKNNMKTLLDTLPTKWDIKELYIDSNGASSCF